MMKKRIDFKGFLILRGETKNFIQIILFVLMFLFISSIVSADSWINLGDGNGEVKINNPKKLDDFSKATWNMWVKQTQYVENAGIIGKYAPRSGKRSYLIRTSLTDEISIFLSDDGIYAPGHTTSSNKNCGIRKNGEWTMITITYDGNNIEYYRNAVLCDTDKTKINSIFHSTSQLRFGGGNNIFFNGEIDGFTIYDAVLSREQIKRLYDESSHGLDLKDSLPVLVYHRIEDFANEKTSISTEDFDLQMNYLNEKGFQTITLEDYGEWKNGRFDMPKKSVILTFDDGYSSTYSIAYPKLDELGFVGSVNIVTRYASFTSKNSGYMNWEQIYEMVEKGWDVQSHSVNHKNMLTLNESEFRKELIDSKNGIYEKIHKIPAHFVFPFHESNQDYTDICAEEYEFCWTQGSINPSYNFISTPPDKYLGLRRINIINSTNIEEFKKFLGRDTDKVGEWNMDEGWGDKTFDESGNKNDGELINAYWTNK